MEQVIPRVWVGSDKDVTEAKRRGYSRLCACKDGPDGHRVMLGYTTLGAPQGPEYLYAQRGDWFTMNVVDNDDEDMIANEMIFAGLRFAIQQYDAGKKLLIHCNHGHGRGPSMGFMFLRAIGEFPYGYLKARRVYTTLYPQFEHINAGMPKKVRELWDILPTMFARSSDNNQS